MQKKEVFLYLFLFTLQLCCHCPFTVLYCVKYIKVVSLLVVKPLKISIYNDNKPKKILEQVLHVHHNNLDSFRIKGLDPLVKFSLPYFLFGYFLKLHLL